MNRYHPHNFTFPRDSRHIFGSRFQVEKPSRDWMYLIAAAAVIAVIIWIKLP